MTGVEIVKAYFDQNMRVVYWPDVGTQKGPTEKEWPHKPRSLDEYNEQQRVGLITGTEVTPGKHLIDVDIDWHPGASIALKFLPHTNFVYGRASKKVSHAFYTVPEAMASLIFKDPIDKIMLIELRGAKDDGQPGFQSMVPPSVWANAEGKREPLEFRVSVSLAELRPSHIQATADAKRYVTLAATGMLLAKHLGLHGFGHDTRLAWAGFLLRLGADSDDLIKMGLALSDYCDNTEVADVERVVQSTVTKLKSGNTKVAGISALKKIIGENGTKIVKTISEWFERIGLESAPHDEFKSYFIAQIGSTDGGSRKTVIGNDETFPPYFQTVAAFKEFHLDTSIRVDGRNTTRADQWLRNPKHRKYSDVQFVPPPLVAPAGVLNLWNGFAIAPDPEQCCALFLAHVREVICAGEDPDVAEFLLDVLAKKVQQPARLTEVSVAMRGGQGVGKNTLTDYYGAIFGRHAVTVDKQELVTGRFNAVLLAKLMVVLDEAMWPGHKEFVGALKSLVTSPTLMIERKGIDPVREQNFTQMFVLTNKNWVWPTELGDRRALILDVTDAKKGDTTYFDALHHERLNGGPAALLAFLQQREITHDLRLVPHTTARATQVALTDDDPVRSMWFDMLWRGTTWPESEEWEDFISTEDLYGYHKERCKETRQKPLTRQLLVKQWHKLLPKGFEASAQRRIIDRDVLLNARRMGGWRRDREGNEVSPEPVMRRGTGVPTLDKCRKHYETTVEKREWSNQTTPDEEYDDEVPF